MYAYRNTRIVCIVWIVCICNRHTRVGARILGISMHTIHTTRVASTTPTVEVRTLVRAIHCRCGGAES